MPATTYDPKNDSSAGTERYRVARNDRPALAGLILVHGTHKETDLPLCLCGCAEPTNGKRRLFKQGHDQRLRGRLTRAHLNGTEVHTLVLGKDEIHTGSATQLAKYVDSLTGGHHWSDVLRVATAKATETTGQRAQRLAARAAAPAPQPEPADQLQAVRDAAAGVRTAIAQRREQAAAAAPEPIAGTVKVGRWDYPARQDPSTKAVERNTARDGSGEWVPADPRAQAGFTAAS
jgi:hypothetical protein